MNIINDNKYLQFKHILSGCRTILDAYNMARIYCDRNPEMKAVVHSMINGKRYENNIFDFRMMNTVLHDISTIEYSDDAMELVEKLSKETSDNIQRKTLEHLAKNKPNRPIIAQHHLANNSVKCIQLKYNGSNTINDFDYVTKSCPHCAHGCEADIGSTHVVCGYSNNKVGFDWMGCGNDWCFQCGKMLCKSWYENKLTIENNKKHDGECCKKHAKINEKSYPNDYCQCKTSFVTRN